MQLSQVEVRQRVLLFIAHGIVVGRDGLIGEQDPTVALRELHGALSLELPFLRRCLRVGLAVLGGGIVIFAYGIELVAFLHGLVSPAAGEQQATYYYI